jgi:polyferredoxin
MKNNKAQDLRKVIQYLSLGITLIVVVLLINGVLNSAHGFCPYASICFGVMSAKLSFGVLLFPIAVIAGLTIAVTTIFWGRRFCGYVCPFGTVQELIFNLNPKSRNNRQLQLPIWLHRFLKVFKYVILFITILAIFRSVQYGYMRFCPVLAVSNPLGITIYSALTLFAIFVVGFFINRFWCRYLCPYAALMNVFQYIGKILKIPSKRIQVNEELCRDCKLCSKNCPMQIDVHAQKRVTDVNCIFCLKCLQSCPAEDGIKIKKIKKN